MDLGERIGLRPFRKWGTLQSPPQPPPNGGGLFAFQALTKVNFRHVWKANSPFAKREEAVKCLEVGSGFEPPYEVLQTSA